MMRDNLWLNKIKGSILGGAIGDALGGPLEGKSSQYIREHFGSRVADLVEYSRKNPRGANISVKRGTYTDDTRLKNILCKAITKKKGKITADDFAQTIIEEMNPELFWPGEDIVYQKVNLMNLYKNLQRLPKLISTGQLVSLSPRNIGKGNIPADDAAMIISPIGLLNPANPRQAAQDAYEIGSLIQNDYSLGGAVAVASAVAEAMNPETSLDKIINESMNYTDKANRLAIDNSIEIAKKTNSFVEFKELFYQKMLVGFVDVLEVVPFSLGIVYLCGDNFEQSVIEGANSGRDCDTIASIVGSIVGAYLGVESLPKKWLETVIKANPEPDLIDISNRIYEALKEEIEKIEEYVRYVKLYL